MPHVHCGSIIGYIEKRCASAADERRRPSRFCPRYVSAVSEARFHDKVGGEAGVVAGLRYDGQHGKTPPRMVRGYPIFPIPRPEVRSAKSALPISNRTL